MPPYTADSPAKKQSKWSAEEDALIIELRGSGMKWEDISKKLPGRSAISCRLHYQNYLERRSEWDEERKNKLARLYERFKPEMWAKVAEEMQVPWRAAEAMHWQLGEADMARRAGVTPFSLTSTPIDSSTPTHVHRRSPSRAPFQVHPQMHAHRRSQSIMRPDGSGVGAANTGSPRYGRGASQPSPLPPPPPMLHVDRLSTGATGSSLNSGVSGVWEGAAAPIARTMLGGGGSYGGMTGGGPSDPANSMYHYQHQQQHYTPSGPGLPPIQTGVPPTMKQQQEQSVAGGRGSGAAVGGGGGGTLPSLAEITTGVNSFNTPTYSLSSGATPRRTESLGSVVPGLTYPPGHGDGGRDMSAMGQGVKRRASPILDYREPRRRYINPSYYDETGDRAIGQNQP